MGAAAVISGLGAALGVLHFATFHWPELTLGCVIIAALGLEIEKAIRRACYDRGSRDQL